MLQPAAFLLRISESCDFPDVAGGGVEIPETSFLTQARAEAVPVPVLPVQGPNSYRLYIQNAVIDLLTILFESPGSWMLLSWTTTCTVGHVAIRCRYFSF